MISLDVANKGEILVITQKNASLRRILQLGIGTDHCDKPGLTMILLEIINTKIGEILVMIQVNSSPKMVLQKMRGTGPCYNPDRCERHRK